jgi:hypothetical protein
MTLSFKTPTNRSDNFSFGFTQSYTISTDENRIILVCMVHARTPGELL